MLGQLAAGGGEFQPELVGELADAMFTTSICGLGQVAATPIRSVMKYFPDDLRRHLTANAAAAGNERK